MVRFKNRWLLLSITALPSPTQPDTDSCENKLPLPRPEHVPPSVTAPMILREVRTSLERYFGDAGAGTAGGSLAIRYYNPRTGTAILRCARENARVVWASLAMVSHIETVRCRILCKHLAGTIKKAQLHAIDQDRQQIFRLRKLERQREIERSQRSATALDSLFAPHSDPELRTKRKRVPDQEFSDDPEVRRQLETSKRQILSLPPTLG